MGLRSSRSLGPLTYVGYHYGPILQEHALPPLRSWGMHKHVRKRHQRLYRGTQAGSTETTERTRRPSGAIYHVTHHPITRLPIVAYLVGF